MRFKTINSTYELDQKKKRMRRIKGITAPTPNQGTDGEWKPYEEISPVEVGVSPLVWWNKHDNKATLLGQVQEVCA